MQRTWKIKFKGEIIDGFNLPEVKQESIKLLKISEEKIEVFFSGKNITLKKGITKDSLPKYIAIFKRIGMRVYFEEEVESKPSSDPSLSLVGEPKLEKPVGEPKTGAPKPSSTFSLSLVEEPKIEKSTDKIEAPSFSTGLQLETVKPVEPLKKNIQTKENESSETNHESVDNEPVNDRQYSDMSLSDKIELINDRDKIEERPPMYSSNLEGRLDSVGYLIRIATLSITIMVLDFMSIMSIVSLLLIIPNYYFFLRTNILRLHDMNLSGYWVLVFPTINILIALLTKGSGFDSSITQHYVMLNVIYSTFPWFSLTYIAAGINLALFAFMCIRQGTKGENDYGSPVAEVSDVGNFTPSRIGIIASIVLCAIIFIFKPIPANNRSGGASLTVSELNTLKLHTGDFVTFEAYVISSPRASFENIGSDKAADSDKEQDHEEENYDDEESYNNENDSSNDGYYGGSNPFPQMIISDIPNTNVELQKFYDLSTARNKKDTKEYLILDEYPEALTVGKKYRFKLYKFGNRYDPYRISEDVVAL